MVKEINGGKKDKGGIKKQRDETEVKKEGIKLTIPVGLCSCKDGGHGGEFKCWESESSSALNPPHVIHRHQVLLELGDGDVL